MPRARPSIATGWKVSLRCGVCPPVPTRTTATDRAPLLARWSLFAGVSAVSVVILGWGTFVLLFSLPASCSPPIEQIQAARQNGLPVLFIAVLSVSGTFAGVTLLGRVTSGQWMWRWIVLGVVATAPLALLFFHAITDPGFWNSNAFCF